MSYELLFLQALILTIIIETVTLFLLIRYGFKIKKSSLSTTIIIFSGILTSFSTLPYLWFIFPYFLKSIVAYHIFGELTITAIEGIIYFFTLRLGWKRSIALTVICNLVSYSMGLLVF